MSFQYLIEYVIIIIRNPSKLVISHSFVLLQLTCLTETCICHLSIFV